VRTSVRVAAIAVVVLAAAQLIRPDHSSPATDPSRTIHAQRPADSSLATVLDRACNDCHSHQTRWPWYTQVAPVSWVMAYAVKEGRRAVNYSDWAAYSPERQRMLLLKSCQDVTAGRMPGGAWTTLHSEARLTNRDVDTICAAAGS
jgi:hypothetical protein